MKGMEMEMEMEMEVANFDVGMMEQVVALYRM